MHRSHQGRATPTVTPWTPLVRLGSVGSGASRQFPVAIVLAIDANDVKMRGQLLDLTQEVICGESPSPNLPGRVFDVAARLTPRSTSCVSKRRHQHRVSGVVQLELVDAQQPRVCEPIDAFANPSAPTNASAPQTCRRPLARERHATGRPEDESCRLQTHHRDRCRSRISGGVGARLNHERRAGWAVAILVGENSQRRDCGSLGRGTLDLGM